MTKEEFVFKVMSKMKPGNVTVMNDLLKNGLTEVQKTALEDLDKNLIDLSYGAGYSDGVKDSLFGMMLFAGIFGVAAIGSSVVMDRIEEHQAKKKHRNR